MWPYFFLSVYPLIFEGESPRMGLPLRQQPQRPACPYWGSLAAWGRALLWEPVQGLDGESRGERSQGTSLN